MGTRVRGNMIGEFPGLKNGLDDDGNLKATVDYRSIYCSVLEQWLGTDAGAVIPEARSFARGAAPAMRLVVVLLAGIAFAARCPPRRRLRWPAVQVVALEFNYRLSRVRVPAGPVRIELANFGQDEHDLALRKIGTTKVYTCRPPCPASGRRSRSASARPLPPQVHARRPRGARDARALRVERPT